MSNMETLRKILERKATEENLNYLLDFFGFHAYRATTNQPLEIDASVPYTLYYFHTVVDGHSLYLVPCLGLAVGKLSHGGVQTVKLSLNWRIGLDRVAQAEVQLA